MKHSDARYPDEIAADIARRSAADCSALEVALEKYREAKSILAENPEWKPAQERFADADKRLQAECESAIADIKAKILPNAIAMASADEKTSTKETTL
jgi:hypothetical protein